MGGPVIAVVVVAVIGLAAWLAASRAAAAPVTDTTGGDGSGAGGGAGGGTEIIEKGGTPGNGAGGGERADADKGGGSRAVEEPKTKPIIQPGDDGYHPKVTPTPGKYYQVKPGDNGSAICNQAGYVKPYAFFIGTVVKAPENQWIAYDKAKGWTGDLLPKYSGYLTAFGSGHLHPPIFLPLQKV